VNPYERVWTLTAGAACGAGFVAAFMTFPPLLLAQLFVAVGLLGALVVLPWLPRTVSWAKPLALAGVLSGLLTWVCVGLAQVVGAATVVLLVVLPATAPATAGAWSFLGRRLGWHCAGRHADGAVEAASLDHQVLVGAAGDPPAQWPVPLPDEDLDVPDLMTDLDLCHAWRSSFVALQRAGSVESRVRVVTMRALYLDELERRAGPALLAWFGSGARAAGDPTRFLFGGTVREP